MLDRGMWNGRRVLSEAWIEKSTHRQGDMPFGADYGYLWQRAHAFIGSERVDAFWASGNGGQYIIVFPNHEMVLVFTGGNFDSPLAGQPFRIVTLFILPALMKPAPLETVVVADSVMQLLSGTYGIDFEPSVTATVSAAQGRLRMLTPDGEQVALEALSESLYAGESAYGPLHVEFEFSEQGQPVALNTTGSFSSYRFVRK